MATQTSNDADKPLDPAVEKVRRKLLRFAVINIGLLFVALMAVLAAVVYKTGSGDRSVAAGGVEVPSSVEDAFIAGEIVLPQGAKMISHALAGNRLSIDAELADGSRAIFVYDMGERRIIGRLAVRTR